MGLFRRTKNNNKPVLAQIIGLIPRHILQSVVSRYQTDKHCSRYKTYDQLVALMFGQLSKCSTLEDISAGIGVSTTFIKDLGLHQSPARSTMSDGNRKRNAGVFEALYYKLLGHYTKVLRPKHRAHIIEEVKHHTIKITDSTTVSLCLSLFNWAKFRTAKGGIKIHTTFDESLMLPELVNITEARKNDRHGIPREIFAPGTIIIEDKGYFDFSLMAARIKAGNWFVTRIKSNTSYEVIATRPLPEDAPDQILSDEEIMLTGQAAIDGGMGEYALRKVVVYDEENDTRLVIITNNFEWSAETIAGLYKMRWDIEIFFKQLKQHLKVKTFIGTSPNAVKSQIYVALICFLLLELLRRNTCKAAHAFSNFTEKVRLSLAYYLSLDYVCNTICQGARAIAKNPVPDLFSSQARGPTLNINNLQLNFT